MSLPVGDEDSPLVARLRAPALALSLEGLAARWFRQEIVVTIDRPERHDAPLPLLNRIRGAFGEGLKHSASAEAIAGLPCAFDPPCALDVLFREQLRLGGHGLPKPYVLALDLRRRRIDVTLTLFGFACDWAMTARDSLVQALAQRVIWVEGEKPARAVVRSADIVTHESVFLPPPPAAATLDFLTPFDATGTDFLDHPPTLVARLARRIDGLARWMDARLDLRWEDYAAAWNGLRFSIDDFEPLEAERGSRRQRKVFRNPVIGSRMTIDGDLGPVWPFLALGETCHVGRGAVAGYGRYRLAPG